MGRATRRDWIVGLVGLVGLVVCAVLAWRRWRVGDVDPASLVMGVASLGVAIWPLWQGRRQENDPAVAADRLARSVGTVERRERARLLGDDDQVLDLDLRIEPAAGASRPASGILLTDIAAHFRSLPVGQRRLVITGAAGSGKTVLALQLMLELLAQRESGDPVPVRLSLSAWQPDMPLEGWLALHLQDGYGLNAATATALVESRRVLPVLDGLDEMDGPARPGYGSRAARAVRAMNAFRDGTGKADVVLTCRTGAADALRAIKVWPKDATRVEIAPVRPATVRGFLARRSDDADRWAEVLAQVEAHPRGTLARGLSTPWRLTAAVTVYEQRDPVTGAWPREPNELRTVARRGPKALRDWLNEYYLRARAAAGPYSEGQVYGWLALLASHRHRGTGKGSSSPADIVLQRLPYPDTLAFLLAWLCPLAAFVLSLSLGGPLVQPLSKITTVCVVCAESWAISRRIRRVPPTRRHVDVRRLGTGRGLLRFGWRFASGLVVGYLLMLLAVAAFAHWAGGSPSLELPFAAGLATGFVNATVFGLGADSASLAVGPNDLIRNDVVSAAVALVPATLLCAVVVGGQGSVPFLSYDLHGWPLLGTALLAVPTGVGLVFATGTGLQALGYLAFLLHTRRYDGVRLPFRLGRFLTWCHRAGLVRVSGAAYQFRHRELQDLLARRTASERPGGPVRSAARG